MLAATQLVGFGAFTEVAANPVLTVINAGTGDDGSSPYNLGNFNYTEAGLAVISLYGGASSSRTLSSATLGGTALTEIGAPASGSYGANILYAEVNAGNHALSLTFSGTMLRCYVAVYLITGLDAATPFDFELNNSRSTGSTYDYALNFPDGGVAFYVARTTSSVTHSWSGAVEDYDEATETGRTAFAHKQLLTGANPNTETVTFSGSAANRQLAAAVFR